MNFVYSGGFEAEVTCEQYNQTRMQMGLSDDRFSYPLAPGEQLVAPEVIMTYSNAGIERVSQNFHRCIRKHVCRGMWRDRPRPVLLNSWEAFYFDFTGESLVRLAEQAASLGIEMLVMDDGWFSTRRDDFRALGDWTVNEGKLGGTLQELVDRVNALGLKVRHLGGAGDGERGQRSSTANIPTGCLRCRGRAPCSVAISSCSTSRAREVRDNLICRSFAPCSIRPTSST